MGHIWSMMCFRRVVIQKGFYSKSKKGRNKIRMNDDQKQVNWGIPWILNGEIDLLQRYRTAKSLWTHVAQQSVKVKVQALTDAD